MDCCKGSIWRRWDLHFHTPSSYDYQDKSVTNKEIVEYLKKEKIEAISITDHHCIDIDRIKEIQRIGHSENLTVFPGIELRTDKGGSESIHIIGIFPEDIDLTHLRDNIRGRLNLTEKDIHDRGNDRIYCNLEKASILIHELGGIVSIHAGRKTNSVEEIKNSLSYKMAQKMDILEHIDIYEVQSDKDIKNYKDKVFPNISKTPPLIICSDNHNIRDSSKTSSLWIKADLSFSGLKQILREPEARVSTSLPEIIERVSKNKTRFIKKICINKSQENLLAEEWFANNSIDFNPELVAIIGNKGMGKSALSDTIGLLGNTKNYEFFSFLAPERFRKKSKANNFTATITWESAETFTSNLGSNPAKASVERIKYIPQKFFENLCNEDNDRFESELKEVIFSHIPVEDRLDTQNLDELLEAKNKEIAKNIDTIITKIEATNEKIISLEKKAIPNHLINLIEKRNIRLEELKSLIQIKPKSVQEPAQSQSTLEQELLNNNLRETTEISARTRVDIEKQKQQKKHHNITLNTINNFKQAINSLSKTYKDTTTTYQPLCDSLSINVNDVVSLNTNIKILDDKIDSINTDLAQIAKKLDPTNATSLVNLLEQYAAKITEIQNNFDAPMKKYQQYVTSKEQWREDRDKITAADSNDSITFLNKEIRYINKQLGIDTKETIQERTLLIQELLDCKFKIIDNYKTLYEPITLFMDEYKDINEHYFIGVNAAIHLSANFYETFLSYIHQKTRGTFQGKNEGYSKLASIVASKNLTTKEELTEFINAFHYYLTHDTRAGSAHEARIVEDQLIKDKYNEFYNYLYSLKYLLPIYKLTLSGKELTELSPGEKGALLLIFYLILDQDTIPLVIDQPEDNLDNQSVYKILVPFLKMAKKRRQIIIVTHNPNLAIVCDAEQIVHVSIDKQHNCAFAIKSGSIENHYINAKAVEILEGTLPAFRMRDDKYEPTKNSEQH